MSAHDDLDAISAAEATRKKRGLLRLAAAFAFVGLIVLFFATLGREQVGLKIPLEAQEGELLSLTNDPQCRALIADVTQLAQDFKPLEQTLESDLLHDDHAKVQQALDQVSAFRARLDAQRQASLTVALRFEPSAEELKTWFAYMDEALSGFDRIAQEHLAGPDSAPQPVDLRPNAKKKKPKLTHAERRDAVVINVYDTFARFRAWHTASMHPCGAADPGETPWTPPPA